METLGRVPREKAELAISRPLYIGTTAANARILHYKFGRTPETGKPGDWPETEPETEWWRRPTAARPLENRHEPRFRAFGTYFVTTVTGQSPSFVTTVTSHPHGPPYAQTMAKEESSRAPRENRTASWQISAPARIADFPPAVVMAGNRM